MAEAQTQEVQKQESVFERRARRLEQLHRRLIQQAMAPRVSPIRDSDLGNVYTQNRRSLYQELVGVYRLHPWSRAGLIQIGRAILGPGFTFVPKEGKERTASREELERLKRYFGNRNRRWDNIKDYYGPLAKLYITAIMVKLFGQAAWETVRNYAGEPIGFDVIFARIEPNVDARGYFLDPPWYQYSFSNPPVKEPIDNIDDIVYFVMPDIQGYPTGASDLEALVNVTLPADLQAALAFLNDIKNTSRPDGIWWASENVSDEDFEAFVEQIEALYTGVPNVGRAFITVKGEAGYQPFGTRAKDMMWSEGREFLRQEALAVIGTPGSQIGLTQDVNRSNVREARILFFENIVRPLQQAMAEVINLQVLERDLGIEDWEFRFKAPDFTTETEDANNAVKLISWGLATPNEIRTRKLNLPPYQGGDRVYIPLNVQPMVLGNGRQPEGQPQVEQPQQPQQAQPGGSPPQGQYPNAGRPTTEERISAEPLPVSHITKELNRFRKKARRIIGNGKNGTPVEFQSDVIPPHIMAFISGGLELAKSKDDVDRIFDRAKELLNA